MGCVPIIPKYFLIIDPVFPRTTNFMICAIIQKGTDRRLIKNLKDGENKGEKSMQPYRK